MFSSTSEAKVVRFGPFELELQNGSLARDGRYERLPVQPSRLLVLLVQRPGELVTREELRTQLWPDETFVDFDHGLNNAVNRVREALRDSATSPRYIQTVPRRGYRFIADVTPVEPPAPALPQIEPPPPQTQPPAGEPTLPASRPGAPSRLRLGGIRPIAAFAALLLLLAAAVWWKHASAPAPIRSIAVLPFANFSRDSGQDYLADSIADELTSDLARIGAFRVISRTSVTPYKKAQKTVPEIARELNVDALVEGSVNRGGDSVRVTAELIDARTDTHLWSQTYQRSANDLLQLQSDLTQDIAAHVKVAAGPAAQPQLHADTTNPAAYEAYMRGRSYVEKWTIDDSTESLRYFQRAVQIDANYALAYIGMAECYRFGIRGLAQPDALNLAVESATHALQLRPDMGEAHAALGFLRMLRDHDFTRAEAELKQGIALSPNYAPAHHWYSHMLMNLGRYDESMVQSRKLLELDPVSPAANLHLGNDYLAARQWDLAIAQEKKTLAMDPNYLEAHRQLSEAYLGKRMYPEAIAEMRRAAELAPVLPSYPNYEALLGNVLAQSGDKAAARKILAEIKPLSIPMLEAILYSGLGDKDAAFTRLSDAHHRNDISIELGWLVEYDPIRNDPRFPELLHRVGLR